MYSDIFSLQKTSRIIMEIVYSPIIRPGNVHARVDSTITSALSKHSSLICGIEILGAHHAVA